MRGQREGKRQHRERQEHRVRDGGGGGEGARTYTATNTHARRYGRSTTPAEPADPSAQGAENLIFNVDLDKGGIAQREFYEFHKAAIVCVHFRENVLLDMVTVDESGWLATWKQDAEHFSGHTWYVPEKKVKLDFGGEGGGVKILEVKPSVSGRELFFLCAFGSEQLKVFVLELERLQFLPEVITHTLRHKYRVPPTMCVAPAVASCGSDYVYLVVNGEVLIYSVATGAEVLVANKKLRPADSKGEILGVSVGVSGDCVV